MKYVATTALAMLSVFIASPALSADKIGIFENIFESAASFSETTEAIESAFAESGLSLHGSHVVRVPDNAHQAKVYVLTSPTFVTAAAAESPRTISAQILRVAVYTWGEQQQTYVNMANPVAHAMIYYSKSGNYDALVSAARDAANELRQVVSAALPGKAVSSQARPLRSEKHYRKYKGDGPARMMAKFRTWEKSQLLIHKDTAANFEAVVKNVAAALAADVGSDASESTAWENVARIQLRDDVVYFGITNPFIEDKMIRINSRFRKDGKSDNAPYPGVDHMTALPTEVLVVNVGGETLVLHYGQMWRMQLYFWDSGYRAFTANVGVPGNIAKSIDKTLTSPAD
jgi:hypothetical protein